MNNIELARLLRKIAVVYELQNKNRFEIIAYQKAANSIENASQELYDYWVNNKKIFKLPAIGNNLTKYIEEYFTHQKVNHFTRILKTYPKSLYILMELNGIGGKTAYALISALKLSENNTINDLKKACLRKKVETIEGFKKSSQDNILQSIYEYEKQKNTKNRILRNKADAIAYEIVKYLVQNKDIQQVEIAGSIRRKAPTIGDIDIIVVCKKSLFKSVIQYFLSYQNTDRIEASGKKKVAVILKNSVKCQLRICEPSYFGTMLQYNTGSKLHNISLRKHALKQGYSLSEYGIITTDKKKYTFSNEHKVYAFLGLQYIEPELREHNGELQQALSNTLPVLVEKKDILGDFQIHSNFDIHSSHDIGDASFIDILKKAMNMRYDYVAFTDHNPSIANLTSNERISIIKKRYEAINNSLYKKCKRSNYFIGLEVDILASGDLAIPQDAMVYLDFIAVSIHSSFKLSKKEQTKRIIKSFQNSKVLYFAHPTTRILIKRNEIQADWNIIFKEAKSKHIALEINGAPSRLDLPEYLITLGKNHANTFILGTDAHSLSEMDNIHYAIDQARRGGLTKNDILNCQKYDTIKSWLQK